MRGAVAVLLAVAVAGCSRGNDQIECPAPESGSTAGAVRETPAQIDAAGAQLGRGDENEIAEVVASVRSRHAGASNTAVVNYLVTAYCPRINRRAEMSRSAKRQAMEAFATRVERIVR